MMEDLAYVHLLHMGGVQDGLVIWFVEQGLRAQYPLIIMEQLLVSSGNHGKRDCKTLLELGRC